MELYTTIINSCLHPPEGSGEVYKWNEQPYLDLYSAVKEKNGSYKDVTVFNKEINTKYHESSAAFIPDSKIFYFTRNNYYKKNLKKDDKGISRLQLYRATLQSDSTWNEIKPVTLTVMNIVWHILP